MTDLTNLIARVESAPPEGPDGDDPLVEWVWVAQRIMRWPRLGVCSPTEAQAIVDIINDHIAARLKQEMQDG